jgi:ceroid-lipofuscinosis MFS transporter 7
MFQLDASIGKEFMGWVVAANPLAQMLFSPPAGWWANKLGSITLPLVTSIIIFIVSSAIYSSLEIFVAHRGAWMFISRFLVGVSCGKLLFFIIIKF